MLEATIYMPASFKHNLIFELTSAMNTLMSIIVTVISLCTMHAQWEYLDEILVASRRPQCRVGFD